MSDTDDDVLPFCALCLSLAKPGKTLCRRHLKSHKTTKHPSIFYEISRNTYAYYVKETTHRENDVDICEVYKEYEKENGKQKLPELSRIRKSSKQADFFLLFYHLKKHFQKPKQEVYVFLNRKNQ